MIRYLIKNNFKLMFRNKYIMLVMILCPVLVSSVLSSAFHDLMQSYEGAEEFKAGYRLEEGSLFDGGMERIREAGREAGITFLEYPEGEPEELIADNGLAAFLVFGTGDYTLYTCADHEVEGMMLEYFLDRVEDSMIDGFLAGVTAQAGGQETALPITEVDYMPAINATDYYGIVYPVYFCWCGILCASAILGNERKYGIDRKFRVTAVSGLKLYLGKLVPIVLVVSVGMGLATMVSVLLLDVHLGNYLTAACLLFVTILASSALGLMFYYISHNMAITVIVLFTSVWFMGFVGGSFETYMFSSWSDSIKNLSPIYHINRAMVENSCMGHSDYIASSILYTLGITAVCAAVSVMADGIRKRGRA